MKEKKVSIRINKKKKANKLLFITFSIIVGIIVGIFIAYMYDKGMASNKEVMPYMLLKIMVTIYVTMFLQINIHEFGHFVMGRILGYTLVFYQIGFLSWSDKNGKMTFEIKKNKNYSGACGMIPPKAGLLVKQWLCFFAGGILFNLLSLIPLLIVMYTANNSTVLILVKSMIISTLTIIAMNTIPLSSGTQPNDGKIIFSILLKSPMSKFIIEMFSVSASISQGVRPRDLELEEFEDAQLEHINSALLLQLVCMHYFKALDNMDLVNRERYIKVMQENVKESPSYIQEAIYYELIYYYCTLEFNRGEADKYFNFVKKTLLKDSNINGKRVLAAYEYYIKGNKEIAIQCCVEGLKVVDKYPLKGQALMEKDLIEKIIQKD